MEASVETTPVVPGPVFATELKMDAVFFMSLVPVGFARHPVGVGSLHAAGQPLEAALDSVKGQTDPVQAFSPASQFKELVDRPGVGGAKNFGQSSSSFVAKLNKDKILHIQALFIQR